LNWRVQTDSVSEKQNEAWAKGLRKSMGEPGIFIKKVGGTLRRAWGEKKRRIFRRTNET